MAEVWPDVLTDPDVRAVVPGIGSSLAKMQAKRVPPSNDRQVFVSFPEARTWLDS